DAVFDDWLPAADFLESKFAPRIVELFEAVEAITGIAHDLAGARDIAQGASKVQQANFVFDDLVVSSHLTLLCTQFYHKCQTKSRLIHVSALLSRHPLPVFSASRVSPRSSSHHCAPRRPFSPPRVSASLSPRLSFMRG